LLLVDDDDMSIDLIQILLIEANSLHCRVLVARDGAEALERLRATDVDLVLLDINLPKMDGFELLKQMRAEGMLDRVSVVMCSTSTYADDIARAKQLGACGYLTKPPDFQRLRDILQESASLEIMQRGDAFHLLAVA
jgi:two-component system, chemotaxis family, chemotaxis protein CheY